MSELDRETTDTYSLEITVIDSLPANGDELSSSAAYTITVTDVNDNNPVFNPTSYAVSFLEGGSVSSSVAQVGILGSNHVFQKFTLLVNFS